VEFNAATHHGEGQSARPGAWFGFFIGRPTYRRNP
jgi:hypothetical protein